MWQVGDRRWQRVFIFHLTSVNIIIFIFITITITITITINIIIFIIIIITIIIIGFFRFFKKTVRFFVFVETSDLKTVGFWAKPFAFN